MRICGRIATYQSGCRCDDCRHIATEKRTLARRRQRPTVPPGPLVDWSAAACAGLNPDLFHPIRGENATLAKTVCHACPVQADCLGWALATNEKHGIWGGRSERERRHLANQQPDLRLPSDGSQEGRTDAA